MLLQYAIRVLLVICVAVVVVAAATLIMIRLMGGQLLAVQTNSMEPVFGAGDAVIAWPLASGSLQPGQIVSYQNPTGNDMTVSHRIVGQNKELDLIFTQGDAQDESNEVAVPSSQVSGSVVAVAPGLGKVLSLIRHPIVLLVLVYIPAVSILAAELNRAYKHLKKPVYQLANC